MTRSIWEILRIEPTESKKEIRQAYASLAKECHPEENPVEFQELSDAYQRAMSLVAKNKLEVTEKLQSEAFQVELVCASNKIASQENIAKGFLLDIMISQQEKELVEMLECGILSDMCSLLCDDKNNNKSALWAELFLRDEFLEKQCCECFINALYLYLERHTEQFTMPLPQAFLIELAIAYGVLVEGSWIFCTNKYIPGQQMVADIWNVQAQEWRDNRGWRIMAKDVNEVRRRAFARYLELKCGILSGRISEKTIKQEQFSELIKGALSAKIYEWNKPRGGQIAPLAVSKIIYDLYSYFLRNVDMSLDMVGEFYKVYELRGEHYKSSYRSLKEAVMERYPKIEEYLYRDEELEKKISKWVYELNAVHGIYMYSEKFCDQGARFVEETAEITEPIAEGFKNSIWGEFRAHPHMISLWDSVYLHFNYSSITLTRELYNGYNKKEFGENWTVQKLLVKLTRTLEQYRKLHGYESDKYWEYFMTYGFGIRSIEIGAHERNFFDRVFIVDNKVYLPEYIRYVYEYSGELPMQKEYEFMYTDGNCMSIQLHYHYVVYTLNGEVVYPNAVSFTKFKELTKKTQDAKAWFALFAITRILPSEREEAMELVRSWLHKTYLWEGNFETIINCIVYNDFEKKYEEQYYVEEDEDECVILKTSGENKQLFRYTTTGLIEIFIDGEMDVKEPNDLNQWLELVKKRDLVAETVDVE